MTGLLCPICLEYRQRVRVIHTVPVQGDAAGMHVAHYCCNDCYVGILTHRSSDYFPCMTCRERVHPSRVKKVRCRLHVGQYDALQWTAEKGYRAVGPAAD